MHKKIFILLAITFLVNCNDLKTKRENKKPTPAETVSEENETANLLHSFSNLETIKMDEKVFVHFNPEFSEIINKDISGEMIDKFRVLKTKINSEEDQFYTVDYTPGPSFDPMFLIHKNLEDSLIKIGGAPGLELFIPGNGFIYVSGHTDNMFDKKRKFKIEGNKLIEIEQPFYYVGIDSKLNSEIELFSDMNMEQSIGKLAKGTPVSVLINKGDFYLVKTPFGLTGWVKLPISQCGKSFIDEIYFAGD